ncbi:MAG: ABC transporter ATP-binding protein/permease [Bacilli bacterium]|nr:ABC transporter ATP-binding protein/permease [Bacilli bacterium]
MLRLVDIHKVYDTGGIKVEALKGININFRKAEFVSILGPSGCGKTTTLNIIGGLDHYTTGDLFINGVSTKNYTSHDWDVYRNHRIGFIFQSYNLIPHQNILENVELALTIAGISKEERTARAKAALDKVGLKGLYTKKSNQLSGGQCQRVAIARALVNEPEILLADEPTGALDSVTSVQIMDLIREISKEKLVIMVTHNPELAEKYSTRIINFKDGELLSDSRPYTVEEEAAERTGVVENANENAKMSFWTAFKLSARNLISKGKRTAMVAFAGSIGIIGVSLVLAVSCGVQDYIKSMQDDMISGYPISISETAIDYSSMFSNMQSSTKAEGVIKSIEDGKVNVDFLIKYFVEQSKNMSNLTVTNDLNEDYINFIREMPEENYAAMAEYYGLMIRNNLYTDIKFENQSLKDYSLTAIERVYRSVLSETEYGGFSSLISQYTNSFHEAPDSEDYILSQYDVISSPEKSKFATEKDEIMLVVSKDTEVTDLFLAQLGYYTQDEFLNIVYKYGEDEEHYDSSLDKDKFTYDELMNKKFTYYPNDTIFNDIDKNSAKGQINPFTYNPIAGMTEDTPTEWTTGLPLKITAILRPKKDINYGCLSTGMYYTNKLTKYAIEQSLNSKIVKYLNESEEKGFSSFEMETTSGGIKTTINYGITYQYEYSYQGQNHKHNYGFVGSTSPMSGLLSMMGFGITDTYSLSLRQLGGNDLPNDISIFPLSFAEKDLVTDYLDSWNNEGDITLKNGNVIKYEDRTPVTYSDTISLIMAIISTMINVITIALVAFTALSLVVSTVMIGIITYVSVMERIKEIGVIRSLGGRKKDVSHLFNAETFIIGGLSGVVGIAITYLASAILNLAIGINFGIYTIAALPWYDAVIIILISILLTSISGLVPASAAARKDPVEALRTE